MTLFKRKFRLPHTHRRNSTRFLPGFEADRCSQTGAKHFGYAPSASIQKFHIR